MRKDDLIWQKKLNGIRPSHTGLEGVKTQKKLTGAGIKCKKCINTIPVTTQNLKIGQRGISE